MLNVLMLAESRLDPQDLSQVSQITQLNYSRTFVLCQGVEGGNSETARNLTTEVGDRGKERHGSFRRE
jgi:hypothetical protein